MSSCREHPEGWYGQDAAMGPQDIHLGQESEAIMGISSPAGLAKGIAWVVVARGGLLLHRYRGR